MHSKKNDVSHPPGLLEILPTLPIEEQRAVLQWLREVASELGCAIDEQPLVSKDFLDFLPGGKPLSFLN